jgi:hypothetical protein
MKRVFSELQVPEERLAMELFTGYA